MAHGHLECYDDTTTWAKKIVYSADMKVAHMVSMELLEKSHMPIKAVVREISHQMAKFFEKDIEELLLAEFGGMEQKAAHGWNSASMTDIKSGIHEMAQNLAQGSHVPVPAPQANGVLTALTAVVPGLKGARARCPECKKHAVDDAQFPERKLSEVIIDLNDNHKWTREQIADWLETLDVDLSFVPPSDVLPPAPDPHEKITLGNWDDMKIELDAKMKKDEILFKHLANLPLVLNPDAIAQINGI
jgi:hypothetical protein